MKKLFFIIIVVFIFVSCDQETVKPTADQEQQKQTEQLMREGNRQVGAPAIVNFTEKKQLKWIYELADQENLICYAYYSDEMHGKLGDYIGKCVGYGVPYSTQFTNPDKLVDVTDYGISSYQSNDGIVLKQPEPNGLFKPIGLDATWLILVHPKTGELRPMYIESHIIVSPWPLHDLKE